MNPDPCGAVLPGLTAEQADAAGAHWTAREIAQQPAVWESVQRVLEANAGELAALARLLRDDEPLRIVLTGAGTSAFVGDCLAPALAVRLQHRVLALPTTDLVAGPHHAFAGREPTLLVSFARSGNSPESVAAFDLAQQLSDRCRHLVVTCNADGALRQRARDLGSGTVLVLPEECNDRSFAMTSSFTSMLLAAARALGVPDAAGTALAPLQAAARAVLQGAPPLAAELASQRFERVVFLGANELRGLAREAALKMLELTDGRVVALAETPLGFRHGPKTVINGRTLVVLFLSNDPYARCYDLDLLGELRRDGVAARVVAVGAGVPGGPSVPPGGGFELREFAPLSDLALCLPLAVFAQVLALQFALVLGVRPDNPNAAGVVSRVVRGVTIHRYRNPA